MNSLLFLPRPKHAAYTTRILQPLNTSLAAASFECWGLDHNFSWQRHPSLHLCCCSRSTHLACRASNAPPSWTTSAGAEPQTKAHIKLKYTGRGKSLEVRNSTSRAELLLSPLPCLRLHRRRETASTPSFWKVFLHPSLLHPWVQSSVCCSDRTFSKRFVTPQRH